MTAARHRAGDTDEITAVSDGSPTYELELLAELGWLHSPGGLLDLIDEHWPPEVCAADDPGPRVRSLARRLAAAREAFDDVEALHQPGDWGTCACCAWPYPCETVRLIREAEETT